MSRRTQRRVLAALVAGGAVGLVSSTALAGGFSYNPPGELTPGSGEGRFDETVYAPGMRYPVEEAPSFLNSQVWGHGGGQGPGGSQCDIENFSYPWSDNYCETRSWDMPLCPSGTGHQGQDIRAQNCDDNVHWVVASEAGTVTNVGSYSVYITAADGTRYDYLHMGSVQVAFNDEVAKGQQIGKVSNEFGGTPTTVHLHFNLRQNVNGLGNVYVPTYMSLIESYQALIGPPVTPAAGSLDVVSCESLGGWTQLPSDPEIPIDVKLYFDGAAGDGVSVGHPFLADRSRDDLCESIGSCDHAFDVVPPLSLFDGEEHAVRAYASDGSPAQTELSSSPGTLDCAFELPGGVRRRVADLDSANAWRFSPFWDEIQVSDGIIGSLDEGADLDAAPRIVATADAPEQLWLVDGEYRRAVADARIAQAWDFDPIAAQIVSQAELEELPVGKPVRGRPIVLRSAGGELWLVDDAPGPGPDPGQGGAGSGGNGGDGAEPDGDDEGCSCVTAGAGSSSSGAGVLALLAIAALARRRRS